jgi:hypothetical protein
MQVEAYRSPTSTERVQEELCEFMQSRLSSLQAMHRQMVRHFTGLTASKLQTSSLFYSKRLKSKLLFGLFSIGGQVLKHCLRRSKTLFLHQLTGEPILAPLTVV